MIPQIVSDAIDVQFVNGQDVILRHGLGRPVRGWLLVWRDAPGDVYVPDAGADTREVLALRPTATFNARLVLLS